MQRPMGVTILAILAAIGGVFALLVGFGLFALASTFAVFGVTGLATLVALLLIATGVLDLAFAYGALTLKPWAWTLGIAAEVLSIISNLLTISGNASGAVIGIVIAGAIIYYLYQPHVRRAFGQNA
jgi:hypothetical protein